MGKNSSWVEAALLEGLNENTCLKKTCVYQQSKLHAKLAQMLTLKHSSKPCPTERVKPVVRVRYFPTVKMNSVHLILPCSMAAKHLLD